MAINLPKLAKRQFWDPIDQSVNPINDHRPIKEVIEELMQEVAILRTRVSDLEEVHIEEKLLGKTKDPGTIGE